MEKYIDLHTHTNKSDGSMTPIELVHHAKEAGLSAISLTDHDCIDGVEEAVKEGERAGIEVVPGIEFSAKSETETHILGYYIDIKNKDMLNALEEIKQVRIERTYETSRLLKELGFDVSVEEVLKIAPGNIVGRAHFARIMMEKGYVSSVKEGFDLYLANGKPAYSDRQHLAAGEAVKLITGAGGLAFAAHLHLMRKPDDELFEFIKELKGSGLSGVEGYYTEYTPDMQEKYQNMAKSLGLLISGGTDFHAKMKPHISIGTGLGNLKIPYTVLENIKKKRGYVNGNE
ncbi:MAG TPA: PHP domain-containing protein [Clostridia bacterium]|nr:PHP domain-containing protein [Clostridia bacterium]